MDAFAILRLNLDGDMEDLEAVYGDEPMTQDSLAFKASHCSALIKLIDNNKDILMAQDTWSTFNSMTRIMKRYEFAFRTAGNDRVPGTAVAFSSYPGVLFSGQVACVHVCMCVCVCACECIANRQSPISTRMI